MDAFPDARLVQIIRDGRDVVAAMLADTDTLAWFKPGVVNVDSEFPNPFFGIETEADLAAWPRLSLAGKCAMRWRGTVRAMARLRTSMPAERLTTLRYEQMIRQPAAAARAVSGSSRPIWPRSGSGPAGATAVGPQAIAARRLAPRPDRAAGQGHRAGGRHRPAPDRLRVLSGPAGAPQAGSAPGGSGTVNAFSRNDTRV